MADQRVDGGAILYIEDPLAGLWIQGIGGQAINGFRRQGGNFPGKQKLAQKVQVFIGRFQ